MAVKVAKSLKEHGALDYWECVGDDLEVKGMTSFPRLSKLKPGESLVFAWIIYRSRRHRDQINARVMSDPRLLKMCDSRRTYPESALASVVTSS